MYRIGSTDRSRLPRSRLPLDRSTPDRQRAFHDQLCMRPKNVGQPDTWAADGRSGTRQCLAEEFSVLTGTSHCGGPSAGRKRTVSARARCSCVVSRLQGTCGGSRAVAISVASSSSLLSCKKLAACRAPERSGVSVVPHENTPRELVATILGHCHPSGIPLARSSCGTQP